MMPYYQDDLTTIYHGDARDLAPGVEATTVVTDPPWVGADPLISGSDRPGELWGEVVRALPSSTVRVAIHLGSATDPGPYILPMVGVPFFRCAWLRYRVPRPRGRMLTGADVAYLYGDPPASRPGARVIPGEVSANARPRRGDWSHPCPRSVTHVAWLVEYWSEPGEVVLDPFGGSGTTAVACRSRGRRCVLIEKDARFCEIAATRCSQEELFHALP